VVEEEKPIGGEEEKGEPFVAKTMEGKAQ
jgi:hypothetical protein